MCGYAAVHAGISFLNVSIPAQLSWIPEISVALFLIGTNLIGFLDYPCKLAYIRSIV